MSKPTPGSVYTVKSGDTFTSISERAYGEARYASRITAANQTADIIPGNILVIPELPEDRIDRNATGEGLQININGYQIEPISATVFRSMDTLTDGWTALINWTPENIPLLDAAIERYKYQPATVRIDGNLIITGYLYKVEYMESIDGITAALTGYSRTADMVDSTLKPPYERNSITLEQLANALIAPVGLKSIFEVDPGGRFDRITAGTTDTIGEVLTRYASQRGILVTSSPEGDVRFIRAAASGSVGTIETGVNAIRFNATYDGRLRFNSYRAVGQGPAEFFGNFSVATDNEIPRSRFQTFIADDTTTGNISQAAEWRRNKAIADGLRITVPVVGWYAPNGELWQENTRVTVVSRTAGEQDYIIRSVTYNFGTDGLTSELSLVPPEAFNI